MANRLINKKTTFEKTLPYISLFTLSFALYFVFSVVRDLNPNIIPYKLNKFLGILLPVGAVIIELSKLRDHLWEIWKKIPTTMHILVSFFFSLIILKLMPIAFQKVWNEDDGK